MEASDQLLIAFGRFVNLKRPDGMLHGLQRNGPYLKMIPDRDMNEQTPSSMYKYVP
jgi:hypothetical protein